MNKKKTKHGSVTRIVIIVVVLILVLGILNPNLLFFLSKDSRASLQTKVGEIFGQLPSKTEKISIDFGNVAAVILLIVAIWAVYQVIAFIFSKISFKNRRYETRKRVLLGVFRYAAVILAVVWGLMLLGVNTTAIFASVGIVALVISLGAQSLFADIFTGIFIIVEGQYQVGDIISVDGFRGSVVELGIRTTKLMDVGGNVKIVNNSDIRNIMNLSDQISYAVCDISMAYDGDIEEAEKVIMKAVVDIQNRYPEIFPYTPEYAGVQALTASSVDMRVVARVNEADIFKARRLLNRDMKIAFDKGGIAIPFPQLDVHMK